MGREVKKVVVVGAGFGGLFAAKELEKRLRHTGGVQVTLLDRNNYHLFVPLLYHVGTGGIEPGSICFPIRRVLRGSGNDSRGKSAPGAEPFCTYPVIFRECEVRGIDYEAKRVVTDRMELGYDYLIFAPGSTTNYYHIPGLEEHVVPLKTIADGLGMHNRILENFEYALFEADPERSRELLTFIVVGGGPTGVELASDMASFIFKTLALDFPALASRCRVILAEAGGSLLNGMRQEMGRLALKRLEEVGVEVILGCRITSVSENGIATSDGHSIPSRNVIWVAGVKPSLLAEAMPAERAKDHRVLVKDTLEVASLPGVYVVGDSAYVQQKGSDRPYPPTAQAAVRMGRAAARNIAKAIAGEPQAAFQYEYKGDLVFVGRGYAVGELGGVLISGFPAFWIYQGYHLETLMGFKNKLITLIDWSYDYFYRRDTAKLDLANGRGNANEGRNNQSGAEEQRKAEEYAWAGPHGRPDAGKP